MFSRTLLFSFLLLFLPICMALAQQADTLYLSKDLRKVNSKLSATYMQVTIYKDSDKTEGMQQTFFITGEKSSVKSFIVDRSKGVESLEYIGVYSSWYQNGQLKMQCNYVAGNKEGKETHWYENGQIYSESQYTDDKKQGNAISYYPNGKVKREEIFVDDLLSAGKCFTKAGTDTLYFPMEQIPFFPGGELAMNNYIRKNLKYKKAALKKGIQGLVILQFVVTKSGNLEDIKVVKKLSPELDAECLRVVQMMPQNWQSAQQEGTPVSFRYTLPIRFSY